MGADIYDMPTPIVIPSNKTQSRWRITSYALAQIYNIVFEFANIICN